MCHSNRFAALRRPPTESQFGFNQRQIEKQESKRQVANKIKLCWQQGVKSFSRDVSVSQWAPSKILRMGDPGKAPENLVARGHLWLRTGPYVIGKNFDGLARSACLSIFLADANGHIFSLPRSVRGIFPMCGCGCRSVCAAEKQFSFVSCPGFQLALSSARRTELANLLQPK